MLYKFNWNVVTVNKNGLFIFVKISFNYIFQEYRNFINNLENKDLLFYYKWFSDFLYYFLFSQLTEYYNK